MLKHVCNKCGTELDRFDIQECFYIESDYLGYGTKYDGDRLRIDFCCKCMEEIIEQCVISPITEN